MLEGNEPAHYRWRSLIHTVSEVGGIFHEAPKPPWVDGAPAGAAKNSQGERRISLYRQLWNSTDEITRPFTKARWRRLDSATAPTLDPQVFSASREGYDG